MKATHTPGPWHARKGDVLNPARSWGVVRLLSKDECEAVDGDLSCFGDRSEVIAEVYATHDSQDAADARLLAAAPDLLEALKALWGYVEDLQKSNPGYLGKLCLQDYAQLNTALMLAPKAIKKAEGR